MAERGCDGQNLPPSAYFWRGVWQAVRPTMPSALGSRSYERMIAQCSGCGRTITLRPNGTVPHHKGKRDGAWVR